MKMFRLNGIDYKTNDKGNYFYKSTGRTDKNGYPVFMRIPAHVFEKAFEEYIEGTPTDWEEQANAEYEARKEIEEQKDRETEENFNKKQIKKEQPKEKKAAKPRKSKDVAHESNGITLTTKQVDFIKLLPGTCFWEEGIDSTLWCDCIAEDINWNPMSVGAMISTLREKHLVTVAKDTSRKGHPKAMQFTDLGKQVAKELGLN